MKSAVTFLAAVAGESGFLAGFVNAGKYCENALSKEHRARKRVKKHDERKVNMKGFKKQRMKDSGGKLKAGVSIAALVAAVAMFVILIQMEKSVLADYEKGVIYTAAVPIPRGQMITEENYEKFFIEKQLDKSCIPATAISDPEQIRGLAAVYNIEPEVLLTEGMFQELDDILEGMTEPVIAGFKADDMYQVAGGILRAGDRIHIYSVKEGEAAPTWEMVYVQQVFDASGRSIANEDKTTAAQRVNVYLDKQDIAAFYTGLAEGSLRVVKVCGWGKED